MPGESGEAFTQPGELRLPFADFPEPASSARRDSPDEARRRSARPPRPSGPTEGSFRSTAFSPATPIAPQRPTGDIDCDSCPGLRFVSKETHQEPCGMDLLTQSRSQDHPKPKNLTKTNLLKVPSARALYVRVVVSRGGLWQENKASRPEERPWVLLAGPGLYPTGIQQGECGVNRKPTRTEGASGPEAGPRHRAGSGSSSTASGRGWP